MKILLFSPGDPVTWLRDTKVCTGEVRTVLGGWTPHDPPRMTVYENGSPRRVANWPHGSTDFYCVVTEDQCPQKPL